MCGEGGMYEGTSSSSLSPSLVSLSPHLLFDVIPHVHFFSPLFVSLTMNPGTYPYSALTSKANCFQIRSVNTFHNYAWYVWHHMVMQLWVVMEDYCGGGRYSLQSIWIQRCRFMSLHGACLCSKSPLTIV